MPWWAITWANDMIFYQANILIDMFTDTQDTRARWKQYRCWRSQTHSSCFDEQSSEGSDIFRYFCMIWVIWFIGADWSSPGNEPSTCWSSEIFERCAENQSSQMNALPYDITLSYAVHNVQTLTTLDLHHNSIGIQGAKDLADALKVNQVKSQLSL